MTLRTAVRSQWPLLTVFVIFLVAFLLVSLGFWRRGALLIGLGVGVAAGLRLALSDQRAGLLCVRTKGIDFATTASVAASVLFTALTIDPLGTA